jgi:hypothetical protein
MLRVKVHRTPRLLSLAWRRDRQVIQRDLYKRSDEKEVDLTIRLYPI